VPDIENWDRDRAGRAWLPIAVLTMLSGDRRWSFSWSESIRKLTAVALKWTPPPVSGATAAAYNTYRGTHPGGPYEKIASARVAQTTPIAT